MSLLGLPLLRILGKPFAIVAVLVAAYGAGFLKGKSADHATELATANKQLLMQLAATAQITERAIARAQTRERQLMSQNRWIEEYAKDLRERADACALGPDDLERLLPL